MKLATLQELRDYGSFANNSTITGGGINNNLLNSQLEIVSNQIKLSINRELTYAQEIEYYSSNNTRFIFLKRYPVNTGESVTILVYYDETSYDTYVVDDDYYLTATDGTIEFTDLIPKYTRPKNVKITYYGGFNEIAANITPITRVNGTAYALDVRTTINSHKYKVTTAGTTAVAIPTFNTNVESTTTDGTVTWTEDSGNDGTLDVGTTNPDSMLKSICLKQTTYAVRRINTLGMNSFSTPDGNINNTVGDNYLDDVKSWIHNCKRPLQDGVC